MIKKEKVKKNKVIVVKKPVRFTDIGMIRSVADGIVSIIGLTSAAYGATLTVLTPKSSVTCLILNVEKRRIGAIVLGPDSSIKAGQYVFSNGSLLSVPVGASLLGRIIDPLGKPLDGKGSIKSHNKRMVEVVAPSIITRAPVNEPLETGLKVVDSIVPIGHGQRELIIGDGKTGKTSIVIDAILAQKRTDTLSIYVSIGQKRSSVLRIAKILEENDCLKSTIIVAATASDSAALQFIAPYCGVSMGEYFMHRGLRVLVSFDDLSKQANAYRQISLLLRRPPGREGYPGDVFFVHSRLLERAANLLNSGSITALPIIETVQSDVSAYIPTNVISITDGQIFLDKELYSQGIRPAVSPGLSVSRVGSAAQNHLLKGMAGSLKLELAQFREVEGFTKLGFVLDDATTQLIQRGVRLTRLLIQNNFNPVSMDKQILFLYAALKGYLDWLPVEYVTKYESEFYNYYNNSIFKYPLEGTLCTKRNKLPIHVVWYLIYNFTAAFMGYAQKNLFTTKSSIK